MTGMLRTATTGRSRAYSILFLLVLVAAALLRLPHLAGKGLYYHDEASFMSVGRFYAGIVRYVLTNGLQPGFSGASIKSQIVRLKQMGGSTLEAARPLFYLALDLTLTLFGDRDFVGLLFSAAFSLLTILLFYWFGRNASDPLSYLIAALLLALSVWHVQYSRSVLSQSLSLFFVSWTLLAILSEYEKRSQRPMNLRQIGLLSGLTFNTHYSLFWLPMLVGCWMACVEWQGRKDVRSWLRRMVTLAIFMGLSSLAFEAWYATLYLASVRFTPDSLHRRAVYTYFEQIHNQLGYEWGEPTAPYSLFLNFLYHVESLPFLILLGLGFLYLAHASLKSARDLLLFLWILLPLVIWGAFRYSAPRSYLPCLTPLALGAGAWLCRCLPHRDVRRKWNFLKHGMVASVLIVVGCFQVARILPLLDSVSPYKIASERIRGFCGENPDYRIYKSDLGIFAFPIFRYYLGPIVVEEEPPKDRLAVTDFFGRKGDVPRLRGQPLVLLGCVSAPLERGMILLDAYHWRMVERYRKGEFQDALCIYRSTSS